MLLHPKVNSTADNDFPRDALFRKLVIEMSDIGFGRMARILNEQAYLAAPEAGGVLVMCKECEAVVNVNGDPVIASPHRKSKKKTKR